MPVRVIIADDDAAIRDVLDELLSKFDDIEVAGVASDFDDAVALARSHQPDVAIIDVRMRGGGAAGTRAIREVAPGCAVLAFSAYQERDTVLEMLLAGASGYLVKGAPPTEIVEATRRAAREQATISVDLLTDIVGQLVRDVEARTRAEEVLRRSEERFRALLESAAHAEGQRRVLLAHLVRAQEEERARIASDIHDDSIQVMAAASMRLQILRSELEDPAHRAMLTRLEETVLASIARLRHLLFELRPRVLDSEGLGAALRLYLDELGPSAAFEISFEDRLHREPSPDIRVMVYRIAQEAVTNVRKHANARHMSVTLDSENGGVLLRVLDDGVGLPSEADEPQPGHLGLAAIRERAELAGGWTRLSAPPEGGALVEAWMPDETLDLTPARPSSERTILLP